MKGVIGTWRPQSFCFCVRYFDDVYFLVFVKQLWIKSNIRNYRWKVAVMKLRLRSYLVINEVFNVAYRLYRAFFLPKEDMTIGDRRDTSSEILIIYSWLSLICRCGLVALINMIHHGTREDMRYVNLLIHNIGIAMVHQ